MLFAYSKIAILAAGEHFTSIIRRNKLVFMPVVSMPLGFLAWWSTRYQPGSWDWPWGKFFGVVVLLYGVLVGHFYWAGLRPGAIHPPTAWRCVEELRKIGMPQAAADLANRLRSEGHPFQAPNRFQRPEPL